MNPSSPLPFLKRESCFSPTLVWAWSESESSPLSTLHCHFSGYTKISHQVLPFSAQGTGTCKVHWTLSQDVKSHAVRNKDETTEQTIKGFASLFSAELLIREFLQLLLQDPSFPSTHSTVKLKFLWLLILFQSILFT